MIKYADGKVLQWSSNRIKQDPGMMRGNESISEDNFLLEPKAVHLTIFVFALL